MTFVQSVHIFLQYLFHNLSTGSSLAFFHWFSRFGYIETSPERSYLRLFHSTTLNITVFRRANHSASLFITLSKSSEDLNESLIPLKYFHNLLTSMSRFENSDALGGSDKLDPHGSTEHWKPAIFMAIDCQE
ncbi:hypothetical protein CEXT_675981 [Caerostris extrusa]|uniref:Maturase K n=1 Tax=Caerostris extrusa TaxID=172846 RepID=A0AAV4MNY4_CAEEX|nr:hypothetical protein CEXT_675981 [Caerostris extrusa]